MSAFAVVPTSENECLSPQISLEPKSSMILGHVFVCRHRSSSPDVPRPRAVSFQSSHHVGPSCPSSYSSVTPPGRPKRRLRSVRRPAMCGFIPSHTLRPASSWLNPSSSISLRNVPDCELPSEIDHLILPATGFALPDASFDSCRKNELISLVANSPMP